MSAGTLSALSSVTLENERQTMDKSLQRENQWLRRSLVEEMRRVSEMEENRQANEDLVEERRVRQRQAEESLRAAAEKRWTETQQKKEEQDCRQELERESLREASKQLTDMLEVQRQSGQERLEVLRDKQRREAEKRRERETQLQSRHEEEAKILDLRRQQLDETEQLRLETSRRHSLSVQQNVSAKKEELNGRLQRSDESKQKQEDERCARIARRQMQLQELQGRRSTKFQKQRQEAQALFATLASKRETAMVISASHVQQKCKSASEQATQKDDRVETLAFERQKMWETRRAAQIEAHKILRSAKSEVLKQTMKPKDCLKWLSEQLDRMSANPRAIGGPSSSSSPSRSAPSSPWNLSTSAFPEDRLFEQRAAGVDPSAIHLLSTCTTGS